MATLPKVIFTSKVNRYKEKTKEAILREDGVICDSGISVNEYREIRVRFEHDEPESILRIESYDSESILELSAGEETILMKDYADANDMLVPGYYPFEVKTKSKTYSAYYTIRSVLFSEDSLLNLRFYLESLLRGLSYDLIKERLGMNQNTIEVHPSDSQVFKLLSEKQNIMRKNFELITQNPVVDVIKEYKERVGSKRPDQKSQRWLSKKGVSKNIHIHTPTIVCEKHSKLTINNLENQWVKYIVEYILRALRKLEARFTQYIMDKENVLQRKLEDVAELQKKIQDVERKGEGFKKTRDVYLYRKNIEELKINKLEEEILRQKEVKVKIRHMMSIYALFEAEDWLTEISSLRVKRPSVRLLKDHRYRYLYSFYKEISKVERKDPSIQEKGVPYKKTWLLFEYYSLALVIEILKELGYKWTKGWLADKDNPQAFIGELTSNTVLRFEKEDSSYYLEVAYDQEIELVNSE